MDKQKFYGEEKKTNININTNNDYSNEANSSIVNNNPVQHKIEKYKDFFYILKEDLKKNLDKNVQIAREIQEVEEERSYYLKKIKEVYVILFIRNRSFVKRKRTMNFHKKFWKLLNMNQKTLNNFVRIFKKS